MIPSRPAAAGSLLCLLALPLGLLLSLAHPAPAAEKNPITKPLENAVEGIVGEPQPAPEKAGETQEPPGEAAGEKEPEEEEPKELPTAGELTKGLVGRLRVWLTDGLDYWKQSLDPLTANRLVGWCCTAFALVLGTLLLVFGWSLLKSMFILFASILGAGTGAVMGLQLALGLMPDSPGLPRIAALTVGASVGLVLFLGTAVRARPICWMLVAATPFLLGATFLYPLSRTLAVVLAGLGLVMGLTSSLKRRSLTILSTALLGAFCLLFAWGLLTRLIGTEGIQKFFDDALAHPFAVLGAVGLAVFIGVDLQFILGPAEE